MTRELPRRDVKLQLMISRQELQRIDDWRYANREVSRAAAIRKLLNRALAEDLDRPNDAD